MKKKLTLREMQNAAMNTYQEALGLFKESEVSEILTEIDLNPARAVRKIVRRCGMYETVYQDLETMVDVITDFFIDNTTNILQANSVLNGRTYNPLENYDRTEEQYADSHTGADTTGQRHTTSARGKQQTKTTPGTTTRTTKENLQTETVNTPNVLGTAYPGSKSTTTNSKINGSSDAFSSEESVSQLESTSTTEQLTQDQLTQDQALDSYSHLDTYGKRHIHGNIGVTTSQQMAESELKFIRTYANTLDYIISLFKHTCVIPVVLTDVNDYGYHYDLTGDPTLEPGTPGAFDPGPIAPEPLPEPLPDFVEPHDDYTIVDLASLGSSAGDRNPAEITGGPFIDPKIFNELNLTKNYPDGPLLPVPPNHLYEHWSYTLPALTTIKIINDRDRIYHPRLLGPDGIVYHDDIVQLSGPTPSWLLTLRHSGTIDWYSNI